MIDTLCLAHPVIGNTRDTPGTVDHVVYDDSFIDMP